MKFLVAIAFLALAVAQAHHVPEHTLREHRFVKGYLYTYDAFINVTAGVLGMSSQVSASVLKADVKIYAKTNTDLVLKIENVKVSHSVPAVDHKYAPFRLNDDSMLEDRLSSPIKFTLKNGTVTEYALSSKDNLESAKIKRSILRSLEMTIPDYVVERMEDPKYEYQPVMYNNTENTDYGVHISNYIITASPDVEFPSETVVYNISRIDNCDLEWYPGYKLHHNFHKQGCPQVCRPRGEWKDNMYKAGCPSGFEPHHSPIKRSFSHQHSLSLANGVLNPEIITTIESHFAKMYDQDMEVLIRYQLKRKSIKKTAMSEPPRQTTYDDLGKEDLEIKDEEIDQLCNYKKSDEAYDSAKELLKEAAELIVDAPPGSPVGEKIVLLRDALSTFTEPDFVKMSDEIRELNKIEHDRDDYESVQRQLWLEILPLVGTHESVKFIVKYIQDQVKRNNMLVWEVKEMLESLPQNIERPDEETIIEMEKLLNNKDLSKSILLHSAVHLTMGRIIGEVCGNAPLLRKEDQEKPSWLLRSFQKSSKSTKGLPECPEEKVLRIIEDIGQKLKVTRRPEEIAIYVETLTYTGMQKALRIVADYAHGTAENLKHFTPRHWAFMKSTAVHALHNMVGRYPQDVMEIVLPIFFNDTETPKLRNAAFGVLMRCQPSLAILERIASHSWFEKSREVGSFVTSTLESFGNSTLPCMQLLSHRIKQIIPQVKRFNIGIRHAKNHMWTYFDAVRQFGLEGRFEYTPNNESFIPSTFYQSISYTMDSLRDVVFQNSLNIEGLTQEKVLRMVTNYMDNYNPETIRKTREEEIFGQGEKGMEFLEPRSVEDIRLVAYHKLFYKSCYNYLDSETAKSIWQEFKSVFEKYLKKRRSKYSGHLVKVFLPSTYHTISVAKTLPYPVEFQMRQPIVFSLQVKTNVKPTLHEFNLYLKPSIHMSKIFTHHMKNLGDCKEVGVYHTHKISLTYPFEIKYDGDKIPNILFKYKLPAKTPYKVLYYYTESGTYAGKKELKELPMANRVPIRTLPAPFKFDRQVNLVGIPRFSIEVETEDLNRFHQKLPRTPTEALDLAVRNILNAGWRYKSANITFLEDKTVWQGENEATFKVDYSRIHVPKPKSSIDDLHSAAEYDENSRRSTWQRQAGNYRNSQRRQQNSRQSDGDILGAESSILKQWDDEEKQWEDEDWTTDVPSDLWSSKLSRQSDDSDPENPQRPEDITWKQYMTPNERETIYKFIENAQAATAVLGYLPHMSHKLNISISASQSTAYLLLSYNHTYDKSLQNLKVKAVSNRRRVATPYEVEIDHIVGYFNAPEIFNYNHGYGDQYAGFRTAITWPKGGESTCPFEKIEGAMSGMMRYRSNEEVLEKLMHTNTLPEKLFLPETHEECLRDVRDGKPLSTNCVKAIREYSAYNRMVFYIQWDKTLPENFTYLAREADMFLKYHFYEHLHIQAEENEPNRVDIEIDYIDKLIDEPVANWIIKKPSETVTLHQIPIVKVQPFSSVYPVHEAFLLKMTNNSYPAQCMLSEKYVQTYDLVTYPFNPMDCQYVLSAHCIKEKNFAIILHKKGQGKEIHIDVATSKFVLLPPTSNREFPVVYEGEERKVGFYPEIFHPGQDIYAYTQHFKHEGKRHLRFIAKKAGLTVIYDGKTVLIQVSPRYKGELCGLCSEFDGEEVREFRGMDQCLYRHPTDFANSALVQREGNCELPPHYGERFCEDSTKFRPWKRRYTPGPRGNVPTLQRNVVIYRGDEVCFSVRPVPACDENREPTDTETQRIGFHCLPKDDLTAKKLITEAQWRPLDELRRKSVDQVENVEVPKMC